jgi:hypothetical protein
MQTVLVERGVAAEMALLPDETHTSVLGAAAGRALRCLVAPT